MITQEILSTSTSNEFPIRLENEARCNHNVTIFGFKVWWLQSNINYIESNAVHAFVSHFLDHIYIIIVLNNLCVVFIIAMNCSIQSNFEDSSAKICGNHHQIRLMQKDWIREIETIANIFPFKMVDSRAIQMLAQFPHFTHTPFSHPQNGEWETVFCSSYASSNSRKYI